MGGIPRRTSRRCGLCGQVAEARIPSGFACLPCAMEAFYAAGELGDHSWFPVVLNGTQKPRRRMPVRLEADGNDGPKRRPEYQPARRA